MKKAMKLNTLSNSAYWRIAAPTPAGQEMAVAISSVIRPIITVSSSRSPISARTGLLHSNDQPQSPRNQPAPHFR